MYHNLCFEQKYEKYQSFLSEHFQFLEVKFSIYLNIGMFSYLGGTFSWNGPDFASRNFASPAD